MPWTDLTAAVERHEGSGQRVTFWLRDDDAIEPTAALDRLATLTGRFEVPVALAVIPAETGPDLHRYLAGQPHVSPVVHGWSHTNHAPAGSKKQELGLHRPLAEVRSDLIRGLARLRTLYDDRLLAMLVPPWNRIAPDLLPALREIGFCGLSSFGEPAAHASVPVANTHVDLIDWRGNRGGRDAGTLVGELVERIGTGGPVGLLTHHLVHDDAAWAFLESLFAQTRGRWISAEQALRCAQAD